MARFLVILDSLIIHNALWLVYVHLSGFIWFPLMVDSEIMFLLAQQGMRIKAEKIV